MLKKISTQMLKDYCDKHEIAVPATARREQLEAAIVRASLHHGKKEPHETVGCFGHWDDDMACHYCVYETRCFETSMGTTKEKYFRFVGQLENPKIRITERLSNEKVDRPRRKTNTQGIRKRP